MKLPLCVLATVIYGSALIVVGSLAELLPVFVSPPPETDTLFVTLAGAVGETSTVSVIAEFAPTPSAVLRMQVIVCPLALQFQGGLGPPESKVRPAGRVSVTVIGEVVAAVPELVTVMV